MSASPTQVAMDFSTPAFGTGTVSPGKRGRRESMLVTGLSPPRNLPRTDDQVKSDSSLLLEMREMLYHISGTVDDIKSRLSEVENKISGVTTTVSELQSKVDTIRTDVAFNGESVCSLMEMVNHMQIPAVKMNAVVTGYPKEMSEEERVTHFSGLSKVPQEFISPKGSVLVVKMTSVEKRKAFVKKAKDTKPVCSYSGKDYPIYVRADKTQIQRRRDDLLRQAQRQVKNDRPNCEVRIDWAARKVIVDGTAAAQQDPTGKLSWI